VLAVPRCVHAACNLANVRGILAYHAGFVSPGCLQLPILGCLQPPREVEGVVYVQVVSSADVVRGGRHGTQGEFAFVEGVPTWLVCCP
jgi:hypothetical protein